MSDDSGVDSMFRFRLERVVDATKRYRKMKRRQRVRLDSMESKRDTAWRRSRRRDMTGGGGKVRRRRQLD
jgi:hypothetical protein